MRRSVCHTSTTGLFAARFSETNRGNAERRSVFASNRTLPSILPVR